MPPLFEVCLQSPDDAVAAQAGGAGRVELCAALIEGGITPSRASIELCRDAVDIDIMVMIRPRGGDFCYTPMELDAMARDIEVCQSVGVTGVVFGLLAPDGHLDHKPLRELIELASPLEVTFHRAFDVCVDSILALDQLIEMGVTRVLTSGREGAVPDGLALLQKLHQRAAGRIGILPGAGITPENVGEVIRSTGVHEFHATAFSTLPSPMRFRNEAIYMGVPGLPEYERQVTSEAEVRKFVEAVAGL